MNVELMQKTAHAPAPAPGPAMIIVASTAKLRGRPRATRRFVVMPLRASQGLSMPQLQKVQSMETLMMNRRGLQRLVAAHAHHPRARPQGLDGDHAAIAEKAHRRHAAEIRMGPDFAIAARPPAGL